MILYSLEMGTMQFISLHQNLYTWHHRCHAVRPPSPTPQLAAPVTYCPGPISWVTDQFRLHCPISSSNHLLRWGRWVCALAQTGLSPEEEDLGSAWWLVRGTTNWGWGESEEEWTIGSCWTEWHSLQPRRVPLSQNLSKAAYDGCNNSNTDKCNSTKTILAFGIRICQKCMKCHWNWIMCP